MYREPVLVVDDQLAQRRVASVHLKHHGFDVVEAENVHQAVRAVLEIPELCLAVSDLQIMGGSARHIFQTVGRILVRDRGGLFVVLTNATLANPDPALCPYIEYFRQMDVRLIQKPAFWEDDIIPLITENTMCRQAR